MRYLLYAAVLLFLVGTAATAVTQVRPGERAVVRRFGRVLDHRPEPGLYVGLPWGMDRVDRVPIGLVRGVKVGYQPQEGEELSQATPDGQLLTGDHNLVNLQVEVYYEVVEEQVVDFVVQQDRVEGLVGRAAETALAEWVAGRTVDDVLLRGKGTLPPWLVGATQERIEPYRLGVRVTQASITHLNPPAQVQAEFANVASAQNAIRTQVYKAEQEADGKLRQAEADRFRILKLADAYANEQRLLARAEAETFEKRLAQYRQLRGQNPQYLAGIWWDEMSRLYARMRANGRIDLLDHHLSGDGLDITQFPPLPKKRKER